MDAGVPPFARSRLVFSSLGKIRSASLRRLPDPSQRDSGGTRMIDRALIIRAGGLYLPALLATVLGWRRLRTPRQIAAVLAGMCWCLPLLLGVQLLNLRFRWWIFHAHGGMIRG